MTSVLSNSPEPQSQKKIWFQDRWKTVVCNYGFSKIKININRRICEVGQWLVCFRASKRTIEVQYKTEFNHLQMSEQTFIWLKALIVAQHQLKSKSAVMYSLRFNMSHYAIMAKNLQLVLATERGRATERMRGQERNEKQTSKGEKTTRAHEDTTRWWAKTVSSCALHLLALRSLI